MNEMVERVAKAIYVSQFGTRFSGDLSDVEAEVIARVAIEAMREPTSDMTIAGEYHDSSLTIWQAMIDEALK